MKVYHIIGHSHAQSRIAPLEYNGWHYRTAAALHRENPGIELHLIQPETSFKKEKHFLGEDGIWRHYFPSTAVAGYQRAEISFGLLNFIRKATKEKCILHLHEYRNPMNMLIAAFLKGKAKIVGQHHGTSPYAFTDMKAFSFLRPCLGMPEKSALKKIDRFFAISRAEVEWLGKNITNASNVSLQGMGIDTELFYPPKSKADAKKKAWLEPEKKYAMVAGSLLKGGLQVAKACGLAGVGVTPLLVGQIPDNPEVVAAKKNCAVFTGEVEHSKIGDYFRAADVYVLPFRRDTPVGHLAWEGPGIAMLEAMACGVPAVSTTLMNCPDGIAAMGIQLKGISPQEIARGIEDWLAMQKSGFDGDALSNAVKKEYSWKNIAKKTLEAYKSLGLE